MLGQLTLESEEDKEGEIIAGFSGVADMVEETEVIV